MIAIFLFFTISGSKRHYYILPLMPFCAAFCALYLLKEATGKLGRLRDFLLVLYRTIPICVMLTGFLLLVILVLFPSLIPEQLLPLKRLIPQTMMTLLAGSFVIGVFRFRMSGSDSVFVKGLPAGLARSVFSVYILLLVGFMYILPVSIQFRPEKRALRTMAKRIREANVPKENVYFYDRAFINGVLYLDQPYKITVLKKPSELEALLKSKAGERIFVISQNRFFDTLPPELLKRMPRVVSEPAFPWEKLKKKRSDKKYSMRVLKTNLKNKTAKKIPVQ